MPTKRHESHEMIKMILEETTWNEFHPNGQLWITGRIGIVSELWKDAYDYRDEFKGYEGKPVVRLGVWTKYYDNGQIAWQLDYGDGTHDYLKKSDRKKHPSYRRDRTLITY